MKCSCISIISSAKSFSLFTVFILVTVHLFAQPAKRNKQITTDLAREIKIPMEPSYWEYDTSAAEFITYKNTEAVRSKNGMPYQIFLRNYVFASGTIEFDVELSGMGFPGINFRMSEDRKSADNFYIRSFGPVKPETRTTLQYAAVIDGMSIWDLSDEYQSGAVIYQQKWNHVRLVISGKQMKAYVNDATKPSLIVPELESWRDSGSISLSGNVIYANLVLKLNATEGLNPQAGYISTCNDTRYLRKWKAGPEVDFPFGKEVVMQLPSMYGTLNRSQLPDSTLQWSAVTAESRGVINLSRMYGHKEKDARRAAWLKTSIESDKDQDKILRLGFSDEVWVFINSQIIYVNKNYFGTPQQKNSGRCTIENAEIKLPLKKGKNEILIALANYFYGWGIIARLDDTDGIEIEK
jgi:hypothetical protein